MSDMQAMEEQLVGTARDGKSEEMVQLIATGVNVNHEDAFDGLTPLMFASEAGHVEVVKVLLAAGADPRHANSLNGKTALMYARQHVKVVTELLAACPDGVRETDTDGNTVLHVALSDGTTPEAVMLALIDASPKAVAEKNHNDSFPLHLSLWNSATETTSRKLLEAYPDATKTRNRFDNTPLYLAVYHEETSPELILSVLAANPDAANVPGMSGDIPLQLAVEQGAPQAVVSALMAATSDETSESGDHGSTQTLNFAREQSNIPVCNYEQCVVYLNQRSSLNAHVFLGWFEEHTKEDAEWIKVKDVNGDTLLHLSLKKKAPEAVALALLGAWPGAVKETGKYGYCLLHYALKNKDTPVSVLFALIKACPSAVNVKDKYGWTPLHTAVKTTDTPEGVLLNLIAAACPDAAMQKDKDGNSLLHIALENKNPDAVVHAIRTTWLEAVKEQTKCGDTPLHTAIKSCASEAVISDLVLAWSDAVQGQNASGNTPLHHAIMFQVPDAIALMLVAACREAVEKNNAYGKTPLDVALEKNASEVVKAALIAAAPNIVVCNMYLKQGRAMDAEKVLAWILEHKDDVVWQWREFVGNVWTNQTLENSRIIEDAYFLKTVVLDCSGGKQLGIRLSNAISSTEGMRVCAVDEAGEGHGKLTVDDVVTEINGNSVIGMAMKDAVAFIQSDRVTLTFSGFGGIVSAKQEVATCSIKGKPYVLEQNGIMYRAWRRVDGWLKERNQSGKTLLHVALENSAPLSVVDSLMTAWPGALTEKCKDGYTPLHTALNSSAHEAVAMAIISASQDMVKETMTGTLHGKHFGSHTYQCDAFKHSTKPDLYIFAVHDDRYIKMTAVSLSDAKTSKTPACPLDKYVTTSSITLDAATVTKMWDGTWSKTTYSSVGTGYLVKDVSVTASSAAAVGFPLQLALENHASDAVVDTLVTGLPGAVKVQDESGDIPLRTAVKKQATKKVVEILLAAWKDSIKDKNADGYMALHIALANNASAAVVDVLTSSWPDAVKERGIDGYSVLHTALRNNASARTVKTLIAAWRESVNERDKDGNTPLHTALQHNAAKAVVEVLLDAWPDVLVETDEKGSTPLRIAVIKNADIAVVLSLLACIQMKRLHSSRETPFNSKMLQEFKSTFPVDDLLKYLITPRTADISEDDDGGADVGGDGGDADDIVVTQSVADVIAGTTAGIEQMFEALAATPKTAPLSVRVSSIKDVLNICLQAELLISPTNIAATDFNCGLYMKMHVDPAIALIKRELQVLKDEVAADPDKYRQVLADLSAADRIIYDESFGKTINAHHGGDEAAYNCMLEACAAMKAGRALVDVQRQPTTELVLLVLMVRANIPAFISIVEAVVLQSTAAVGSSRATTTAPKITFRAETKAPYRIIEKSLTKGPNRHYPDVSKVLDVYGCLINCQDYYSMTVVIQAFADKHNSGELDMSRVKVRWADGKTSGGWRDVMLNVVIKGVVFEVQIVLSALLGARTVLDAHKAYNQFRSFVEVFDLLDLSPELEPHMLGGAAYGGGVIVRDDSSHSIDSGGGGADGGGDDGDLVQHKSGVDELKKRLAGVEEALAASDDALSASEKARAGAEEALAASEEARAISEAALAISTGRIAELEAEVEGLRGNSFSC